MTSFQCSPETYARLVSELEHLETVERPAAQRHISDAREDSLSSVENYAFLEARIEYERLDARIEGLRASLAEAEIVEEISVDVVRVGTIAVVDLDGEAWELVLGSIHERHDALDVVSPDSPMGAALMGKSPGETVAWQSPGGMMQVTLVSLRAR